MAGPSVDTSGMSYLLFQDDNDDIDFFGMRIRARIEPVIQGQVFDFSQWYDWIIKNLYDTVNMVVRGQYFELDGSEYYVSLKHALNFEIE